MSHLPRRWLIALKNNQKKQLFRQKGTIMKHLFKHLKKYRLQGILAPLFKMAEACFDLAVPLVVAEMIDVGIEHGDRRYILIRFGLLITLALLGLVCSFTAQYFAARVAVSSTTSLRRQLFSHISTLSFSQIDSLDSSTLITRMVHDVNQVQNGVNMFLRIILRSPLIIAGSAILAFFIAPDIAPVFLAVILLLFVLIFGVMAIITPIYKKAQKQLDDVTVSTRENIMGVRVVRAFGREASEQARFSHANEHLHHTHVKVGKLGAISAPVAHLTIHLATVLVLWLGASRVDGGTLLSGDIIALVNYLGHILTELVKLAHFIVALGKARASMQRISTILDTPSSMVYGDRTESEVESDTLMSFNDVCLRYADHSDDALRDVCLEVRSGQTVGIIGSTGSGKSSIVSLMTRFYDATYGNVSLSGHPIRQWDKQALHKKVGVVMQQPHLFSGTIRKNLMFGNSDATDEQMWQALEIACAADFVRHKEGGLDHVIEEGGLNLSGGQKQRLTIARALVRNPDILILDDSASLLDNATEAALRRNLRQWIQQQPRRAVVVVSERTASVRYADSIYVMEEGHLVGHGSHDSLIADCPAYREMHHSVHREEAEA